MLAVAITIFATCGLVSPLVDWFPAEKTNNNGSMDIEFEASRVNPSN